MGRPAKPTPYKTCNHCGKQMERTTFNGRMEDLSAFKRRVYCGRQCMAEAMEKEVCTGLSYSRQKAARTVKINCEICGKEGKHHVHHRDENPFNNTLSNLMTLCPLCHRRAHSPNWTEEGKTQKPCIYCARPSVKSRLCHTHLSRRQRYGHPLAKKKKIGSEWVLMFENGGEWCFIP